MTLRTTTRSSEPTGRGDRHGFPWLASALGVLAALGACTVPATPGPVESFRLSPEAPAHRAAQSRYFETRDDRELLSASAAVLQDLGFHIEESVPELDFLRAAKERSARESGQDVGRFFTGLLSFGYVVPPVDLHQRIAASLVARPLNADGTRHEVRIMFYRVVWQGEGSMGDTYVAPGTPRMEMIRTPAIYQQFFAKLSKAVFLEAFTL